MLRDSPLEMAGVFLRLSLQRHDTDCFNIQLNLKRTTLFYINKNATCIMTLSYSVLRKLSQLVNKIYFYQQPFYLHSNSSIINSFISFSYNNVLNIKVAYITLNANKEHVISFKKPVGTSCGHRMGNSTRNKN